MVKERDFAWGACVWALLLGCVSSSAVADPGDFIRTFHNPTPTFGDGFGQAVAVLGDDILIGAPGDDTDAHDAGIVYRFDVETGQVVQEYHKPNATAGSHFGQVIAVMGDNVVVGDHEDNTGNPHAGKVGSVHVFNGDTGQLIRTIHNPEPNDDRFGCSVAPTGDKILIGAWDDNTPPGEGGGAFLYNANTGQQIHRFLKPGAQQYDRYGYKVAAAGGKFFITSFRDNVAAWDGGAVFVLDATTYKHLDTLVSPTPIPDEHFGRALVAAGDWLVVGSGNDDFGSAYLFSVESGTLLREFPNPTDDEEEAYGYSVARLGGHVVVGAPRDRVDYPGQVNAGAVYEFDGMTGDLLHTFTSPYPIWDEKFGCSLAVLGNNIVVGARSSVGRVYLFEGIPEPATLALLALGSVVLLWARRMRGGRDACEACGNQLMRRCRLRLLRGVRVVRSRTCCGLLSEWSSLIGRGIAPCCIPAVSGLAVLLMLACPAASESNFEPPELYAVGSNVSRLAEGDFDGDGRVDLVISKMDAPGVTLLRGQVPRGFAPGGDYEAGQYITALGALHWNNDDRLDLAAGIGYGNTLGILYGQPDGRLERPVNYPVGGSAAHMLICDLNGDRRTDIAMSVWEEDRIGLWYQAPEGGLGSYAEYPVGDRPAGLATGDFNRDHRPDLVVANRHGNSITVLYGQDGGGLGDPWVRPMGEDPVAVVVADFDRDGRLDLVVSNYYDHEVVLLYGQDDGRFGSAVSTPVTHFPYHLVTADFNVDHRPDVAVGHTGKGISIFHGTANGGLVFSEYIATGQSVTHLIASDLDVNGGTDLAWVEYYGGVAGVLYNRLPEPATLGLVAAGLGAVWMRKRRVTE